MRTPHFRISSVIRWLLVVAGCVVLEPTQPAFAAAADSQTLIVPLLADTGNAPPVDVVPAEDAPELEADDAVIFPRGREPSDAPMGVSSSSGLGWSTWIFAIGMIAAGAWMLWNKKRAALRSGSGRKIQIEETRPMGNRQYLVVASCEGRRFLLGVTPGRIDVVSALDGVEAPE